MRSIVLAVLLSSSVALAAPPGETPPPAPGNTAPVATPPPVPSTPELVKVDADQIPESCGAFAKSIDSPSINRALSARISLAGCLADAGLKALVLCDCAQSVQDMDTATELSRVLFDEAISLGDGATQILARHAKGDLLSSLAQRLLATVPPPRDATPEAIALHDTRLDLLTPLVEPWVTAAQTEYRELDRLARDNPKLEKNPAVAAAVRATRDRLANAGGVAKR